MSSDLLYQIALTQIPGIGNILAKKLIAYTGSAKNVFDEKTRNLSKIPGIGDYLLKEIENQNVLSKAEDEIKFIEDNKINTFYFLDENYPARLKNCNDSPILFFSKGHTDFNKKKMISIVGTRSATRYGRDCCAKLIKEIKAKQYDATIVSGLAFGIDIAAHKSALENNLETIAVLGHGFDKIYPSEHKYTAIEIEHNGALVTEFLSSNEMIRQNFVRRNRIIAGLTDATIVVESSEKGGALITAEIACSYNRDVLAFPGRVGDKFSTGCNMLIKSNKAAVIESVKDLEYVLNWDVNLKSQGVQFALNFDNFTAEENKIIAALKENGETNIDFLSLFTSIPVNALSASLLNLEFSGIVKSLPGKIYELVK